MNNQATAFLRLVKIMDELREQCPWDKKQTIHTLRSLTIEETYELVDAVDTEDWNGIKEELGDLMLHILFYTKIGSEQQQFQLEDMLNGVCEKLINRHPHIYGNIQVADEEEVKRNWEQIKLKEGKGKKSVLEGVPTSLPAIVKALRIQEKAKQVGFEWERKEQVWEKIEEESAELLEAIELKDQTEIEAEFGDLLFSMVNYARFLHIDPETALERTNRKFIHRFRQMENMAQATGKLLANLSLAEMDSMWNQIKKENQKID